VSSAKIGITQQRKINVKPRINYRLKNTAGLVENILYIKRQSRDMIAGQ
jgi:hypothetical protein